MSDVVDQDVDVAEAADHRLDHGGNVPTLGDVGHEQLGLTALRLDGVNGALPARPVEIDHRHLGALGGEQLGDFLADIAAGAGHDRDLILELHLVQSPSRISPGVITWLVGPGQECYLAGPARA